MTTPTSSKSTLNIQRPGRAARALISGLTGAMLALTGCAAELDTNTATRAERELVEVSPEILGQVKTDDGVQLTFAAEYESGDESGAPVVAITELAPMGAPAYLDHLRQRQATSLEAFTALMPQGTEIPAALRDAHQREAQALGRSTEVRELSLAGMSATYDSSACDSYNAFVNSFSSLLSALTDPSNDNHSLVFANGGNVSASMCNYDSNRVDYKYAQFCYEVTVQGSEFGLLYCDSKIIVPDGHRVIKTWYNATTDRLVRAEKLANYALTVTSYIGIGGVPAIP